jgi:hypothetical protein
VPSALRTRTVRYGEDDKRSIRAKTAGLCAREEVMRWCLALVLLGWALGNGRAEPEKEAASEERQ